jgi:lysophospholipase L1-like esterase
VQPFDTITIYYFTLNVSTAGSVSVDVDGGASLGTIDFAKAAGVYMQTFSCALGIHTVNYTRVSGQVYYFGIVTSNSTKKGINLLQLGHCGAKTSNFAVNSNAYNLTNLTALAAPALTIINLTINDEVARTATATYTSQMQTLITLAKTTGDAILVVGFPSAIASVPANIASQYTTILYDLAKSNNIALNDFQKRWPGGRESFTSMYRDTLHPNYIGYGDAAQFMARALTSI